MRSGFITSIDSAEQPFSIDGTGGRQQAGIGAHERTRLGGTACGSGVAARACTSCRIATPPELSQVDEQFSEHAKESD